MHILIFSQYPNHRIKKIAKALKRRYQISLLCCEDGWNDNEYNTLFENIYFLTSLDKKISDLKRKNKYYSIDFEKRKDMYIKRDLEINNISFDFIKNFNLLYLFVNSLSHDIPTKIIKRTSIKFIYDNYDLTMLYPIERVIRTIGKENVNNEYKNEQICIKHSSGIVSKFAKKCYSDIYNDTYGIKSKNILEFKDYAESENFVKINKKCIDSNSINIAYAGILSEYDGAYTGNEFYMIVEFINNKNILFDLYSQYFNYGKCDNYYRLEKLGFVRCNHYLEYKKLIETISNKSYFSVAGFSLINLFNDDVKHLLNYTIGHRIVTSLEAGLPVLTSYEYKEYSKEVEKYNIGISIKNEDLKNLEQILRSCNYKELLENIEDVRHNEYNLYKNAKRLYEFIEGIV